MVNDLSSVSMEECNSAPEQGLGGRADRSERPQAEKHDQRQPQNRRCAQGRHQEDALLEFPFLALAGLFLVEEGIPLDY